MVSDKTLALQGPTIQELEPLRGRETPLPPLKLASTSPPPSLLDPPDGTAEREVERERGTKSSSML